MNTKELNLCLKNRLGNKINYVGVFSSDEVGDIKIPINRSMPIMFIANILSSTDDVNLMGHWICVYVEKHPYKQIIFLDSFGVNPILYCSGFKYFIERNRLFNIKQLGMQMQSSDSYKCGLYVVYFIHYTSLYGISELIMKIENNFSMNNTIANDRYVTKYYLTYLTNKKCIQWMSGSDRAITYKECLAIINKKSN